MSAPAQETLVTNRFIPGAVYLDDFAAEKIHSYGNVTVDGALATTGGITGPVNGQSVTGTPVTGAVVTSTSSTTAAYLGAVNVGAWVFDVRAYGAKGDGKIALDASIGNGSAVVNSATANFSQADVGKPLMFKGAGASGVTTLVTTIASVQSATQVTLNATAGTAVASAGMILWGTDDTAAIQAAVNAAFTYGQAHGSATIWIPPAAGSFYAVAGPLVTGGTTLGNAQITIPIQLTTLRKVVLTFLGANNGGALRHWRQTSPQLGGSTLVSFGVFASAGAQTTSLNAGGQAAVISGPTGANGYGTSTPGDAGTGPLFNNVMPIFERLNILTTHSANGLGYGALNLHGCANAGLTDFGYGTTGVVALAGGTNDFSNPVTFANGTVVGVVLPASGNNDSTPMRNVVCFGGYTRGIFLTEHANWQGGAVLYCWSGVCPVGDYGDGGTGTGAFHGVTFSISVEGCTQIMEIIGPGAGGVGPQIFGVIDNEGTPAVVDNGFPVANGLLSTVGVLRIQGGGGTVSTNLATSLVVINEIETLGLIASPPTLTINTAVQNPHARYVNLTLAGGTVTSVQLGALLGGSAAPTMQTVYSQSSAALPLYTVEVPPLGWVKINGTVTPTTATWFVK